MSARRGAAVSAEGATVVEADELRLLGAAEVAAVLGTSAQQVREWFRDGTLPSLPIGAGREPRTNRRMLNAWCDKRVFEPTRGSRR